MPMASWLMPNTVRNLSRSLKSRMMSAIMENMTPEKSPYVMDISVKETIPFAKLVNWNITPMILSLIHI